MASGTNKVEFGGNITKDAEFRDTKAGEVCTLNVASEHLWSTKEGPKGSTCFMRVTMFGKTPGFEKLKGLKKGSSVLVAGRLSSGSYVDDKGVKKYTTEIIADSITVEKRKE